MIHHIYRFVLRIMPLVYGILIWWQSGHLNPSSLYNLSNVISLWVIKAIGSALELGHLIEFGLLYLFLILAFLSFERLRRRHEVIALMIAVIYGMVDEIHQSFVPFRSLSMVDFIKDCIGVFIVWFVVHRYYNRKSRLGASLKKITLYLHKEDVDY